MSEQELKLHVPAAARAGIAKELAQGATEDIALHALYFDTPERELARAKVAIRLRREGTQWVQTLKTPGDHALARIELNHERPGPILDLSVYADTPVAAVLAQLRGELAVRYETEVARRIRRVRTRQGVVEIAYDQGCLRASGLMLPISEVEFELLSGRLEAVFELGRRWQRKHGLVLDLRSKSERGDALATVAQRLEATGPVGVPEYVEARAAEIARFWAPRPILPVTLQPEHTPGQALRAITLECLEQIARNAAILTEIDTDGVYVAAQPGHVHQLRVGVRRLRSAWSLFEGWTELPDDAVRQASRAFFSQLGSSRDDDVLRDEVLPPIYAVGLPPLTLPDGSEDISAGKVVAHKDFQAWLLDLLAWILDIGPRPATSSAAAAVHSDNTVVNAAAADAAAADAASADATQTATTVAIIPLDAPRADSITRLLVQRLRRWHKSVVRNGRNFEKLDIESRHALRKRAKRLRYGLAFAESLLPQGRLREYRRKLADVQDVLGHMNDLYVADERFAGLAAEQPHAWFARGWCAARLEVLSSEAQATLRKLGQGSGFWR